MAKIGADYYPNIHSIEKIVREISKIVKIDDAIKLDFNGDPYKLYSDFKTSILGVNNFVVGGSMEQRRIERLHQIDIGALDREALFYNPVEVYKLACEINYVLNTVEDPYKRATSFKVLNNEMEMLLKKGFNLEEIKKDILLDNLLAFNEVDPSHIHTDFNEALVENALSTYNTLCKYDKKSPYYNIFEQYKNAVHEKDETLADKKMMQFKQQVKNYDLNMLRMYVYNRAISDILAGLMQLRYSLKENHSLDQISKVVKVKPSPYIKGQQPIDRRQFSEDLIKNVYNIATVQGECSLGDVFDLFKAVTRELKFEHRDLDAKACITYFADLLTFYKDLVDMESQSEMYYNADDERY